jgi:hypothetical protein
MPVYEITTRSGTWEFDSPRPLQTAEEMRRAAVAAGIPDVFSPYEDEPEAPAEPFLPEGVRSFFAEHPKTGLAAATAARIGLPLAAGAAGLGIGTVPAAGLGATVGAGLAQEIELASGLREARSPGTFTADVLFGTIPGARIARGLGSGKAVAQAASQGAGLALAAREVEKVIDEGELISDPTEALIVGGTGAALGGGLELGTRAAGAVARRLRPAPKQKVTLDVPTQPTDQPEIITPAKAETPDGPAILDSSGRPLGEETPGGFVLPADTPPVQSEPMDPKRIAGIAKRFAPDDEEVGRILRNIEPELAAQSRGTIPDGEIDRLGQALQVVDIPESPRAFMAEELNALYRASLAAKMRRDSLRQGLAADPSLRPAYDEAAADYVKLLRAFGSGRAEAGRALRQAGGPRTGPGPISRDVRMTRAVERLATQGGLRRGVDPQDLLDRVLASIDDVPTAVRILRDATQVPLGNRIRNIVYFNYLSRPVTQLRNILGNTEALVETQAGKALATATGEPGALAGELGTPLAVGLRTGLARGTRKALEILRDGVSREDLDDPEFLFKFIAGDSPTELVGDLRGIALPGDSVARRLGVGLASSVRRSLFAVDALFRSIGEEVALHQGAYARAHLVAKGNPEVRRRLVAELLADVPEALQNEAALAGSRAVFQETPGNVAQTLQKLPAPVRVLFLPFVRTPANLLRRGLQKLPGGAISSAREATRQARAAKLDAFGTQRLQAQLTGEHALGLVALMPVVYLAATGRIVGTKPQSRSETARFFEQGERPNSLRVGGRAIPLSTFGPAGIAAQAVASAVQEFQETGDEVQYMDRMMAALGAAGTSVRDLSFINGLRELFDTGVGDFSVKSTSRIIGRKVSGLTVPGIVQEAERVLDPTIRRAPPGAGASETVAAEVKARVPGVSDEVPPLVGTFGQPRAESTGDTIGQRLVSVITGTSIRMPDAVRHELDRLHHAVGEPGKPVGVSPPTGELTVDKEKLDDAQSKLAYASAQGQARAAAIIEAMTAPAYAEMSDAQRAKFLDRTIGQADRRLRARATILVRGMRRGTRGPLTLEDLR